MLHFCTTKVILGNSWLKPWLIFTPFFYGVLIYLIYPVYIQIDSFTVGNMD